MIDDESVLAADSLTKLFTWVDASYAVHDDRKSHMGGATSFGRDKLMDGKTDTILLLSAR